MSFDKPLDRPVTEYQEVERNAFDYDAETGKVRVRRVKQKVPYQVIYTKAKPKWFTCAKGEHVWRMIDRHKHIAKCENCSKHRFLRAAHDKITPEGHIVDRATGCLID